LRRIRDSDARNRKRILRLRSQARFAQDDTALGDRGRNSRNPLRTTDAFAAGRRALLRKKQTVVEPSAGREQSERATRKAEPSAGPEPAQPSPNVAYRATTATVPRNRASQVRRPPKARALYGTARVGQTSRLRNALDEPARLKRCANSTKIKEKGLRPNSDVALLLLRVVVRIDD